MPEQATPDASTPATTFKDDRPAVLIIGGLGYVGRFLALYIHQNNLASEVRLVDKVLPQLAWLAPEFADACSQDKFMQADASREGSFPRIFTPSRGGEYDYVFNLGGETRYSQDDSVYRLRSLALTTALGQECARRKTPALVELSTGQVYKSPSSSTVGSGGCTETSALKPWTKLAKFKLRAEEELEKLRREQGLRYVILRVAYVWGDYDVGLLARALCLAKVYQKLGKEMKWLWTKDLRVQGVNVDSLCDAAWKAAIWCAGPTSTSLAGTDRIFNVAEGDTSQGTLAHIIAKVFNISTGFQGMLISSFARLNLESVTDDVNEEVLQPWADALKEKGMAGSGPLSPFIEKELLRECHLCLNAEKAERVLGWRRRAGLGEEEVRGVVESYGRMGWWP